MGRKSMKTPGVEFWLGAMPDVELARLSGVDNATIGRWRITAGLPRFGPPRDAIRNESICRDLLLTQNAAVVGRKYKLSRERVRCIAGESGFRMTWTRKGDA